MSKLIFIFLHFTTGGVIAASRQPQSNPKKTSHKENSPITKTGLFSLVAPPRVELGENCPIAVCKEIFRWQLVTNREFSGSRNVITRFLVSSVQKIKNSTSKLSVLFGGASQGRTGDTRLFRPLLYH